MKGCWFVPWGVLLAGVGLWEAGVAAVLWGGGEPYRVCRGFSMIVNRTAARVAVSRFW